MQVRFHGTRGFIAVPGPTTFSYGGNTACLEVRSAAGTLIVLDCGTGAAVCLPCCKSAASRQLSCYCPTGENCHFSLEV